MINNNIGDNKMSDEKWVRLTTSQYVWSCECGKVSTIEAHTLYNVKQQVICLSCNTLYSIDGIDMAYGGK